MTVVPVPRLDLRIPCAMPFLLGCGILAYLVASLVSPFHLLPTLDFTQRAGATLAAAVFLVYFGAMGHIVAMGSRPAEMAGCPELVVLEIAERSSFGQIRLVGDQIAFLGWKDGQFLLRTRDFLVRASPEELPLEEVVSTSRDSLFKAIALDLDSPRGRIAWVAKPLYPGFDPRVAAWPETRIDWLHRTLDRWRHEQS